MKIDKEHMAENAGEAAQFLKCLSNANRLMLLCALLDKERSVSQLNEEVPLSQSALSQHLSVLRDANIVSTRRESQTIYYQLKDPRVAGILRPLYQMFCGD
ncbi:ArsR/SmtB family transcription factor [Aurantivibrio plasticivorans]